MSDSFFSPPIYSASFEQHNSLDTGASPFLLDNPDYNKQPFDFFGYNQSSIDILAPHPDQFESELDSSLAAYDDELNLLPVDNGDLFFLLRSDTPTCGPPSTFTTSTESASAYGSCYTDPLSNHSESYHELNARSPTSTYATSNYSVGQDLEMDFQRLALPPPDNTKMYGGIPPSPSRSSPGGVPNIAHYSPQTSFSSPRRSFSDYEPAQPQTRISSAASDYYPQMQVQVPKHLNYPAMSGVAQSTVSPSNVSPQVSAVPSLSVSSPQRGKEDSTMDDPKRKYQCPSCPRAFARAYNLKTHIQTHDPNRSKPYACHHKSCGRSFSRKHDLTRHLVSIHRSEPIPTIHSFSAKPVGVDKGQRSWCDSCGKSWVGKGKEKGCECDHVK